MYICSAEGQPIDSPFPPLWLSDRDASLPAQGVHCQPVNPLLGHAAARAFKLLSRL